MSGEEIGSRTKQEEDDVAQIKPHRRGRMYIPHGRGKEKEFTPHAGHVDVHYTECGPDWSSRIRTLASPKPGPGKASETTFYPVMKSIRHFPAQNNKPSRREYKFYPPHGIPLVKGKGKVTIFDDIHRASQVSNNEVTDRLRFGEHAPVFDSRNFIPEASSGDKPYQAAEYSVDFHKFGSTRPVVTFGAIHSKNKATIVPLLRSSVNKVKPYTKKEAERKLTEEIETVKSLNNWRPASPLLVPVPETKG